jgi:hypothetical protein
MMIFHSVAVYLNHQISNCNQRLHQRLLFDFESSIEYQEDNSASNKITAHSRQALRGGELAISKAANPQVYHSYSYSTDLSWVSCLAWRKGWG